MTVVPHTVLPGSVRATIVCAIDLITYSNFLISRYFPCVVIAGEELIVKIFGINFDV